MKLIGKRLGCSFLKGRPVRLLQPTREIEVIDMNREFFIVRFKNSFDYKNVFDGGPSLF